MLGMPGMFPQLHRTSPSQLGCLRVHNREKPRLRSPRHRPLEKRVRSRRDECLLPSTRDALCVPSLVPGFRVMWAASRITMRPVYDSGNGFARKSCARCFRCSAGSAERDYARFVNCDYAPVRAPSHAQSMCTCDARAFETVYRIRFALDSFARLRECMRDARVQCIVDSPTP